MAAKNERVIFADLDDYFWHRFLYEEIYVMMMNLYMALHFYRETLSF